MQRALNQNLNLAAALAPVEQARAAARVAGSRVLPSGTFTADAGRQRQSLESPAGRLASHAPDYDRNQPLYNLGAGASWELDLAGGLKAGTRQADAQAQVAEADRFRLRVSIPAEAAGAYFRVRGAQRRIELADEEVKTVAKLLELVRARQKDGPASAREGAQAEALLFQTSATLLPLKIELETQLNRLDVLMGAQPGTYAAELIVPAVDKPLPAIALAQGPADLLLRRPDVIATERSLTAAHATEDVEDAIVTLTRLEERHRELDKEVAARTRSRDAAQEAYKGDVVSLFEALDEERQLLAARDQLAQVRADNGRAVVATFRALGGGW